MTSSYGRCLLAASLLMAVPGATPAAFADQAAERAASHQGAVWDDPERFRALATRTEPWPLRQYPRPAGYPGPFACEPGQGLPVLIGETRLRLPYFDSIDPERAHQALSRSWRFNRTLTREQRCLAPADWTAAPRIQGVFWDIVSLVNGKLDPRCYRPGLPGDPRPECDRPDNGDWWLAFVAGLPLDIALRAPDPRIPNGEPISGLLRLALSDPGHRLEPRPSGGQTLYDGAGRRIGMILPRLDGSADVAGPLFVACLLGFWEWRPLAPETPRAWTRCEVRYRHRGVLDVRYRFYREVFDEPDIPGLDLRVRRLVQTMLDGAEK